MVSQWAQFSFLSQTFYNFPYILNIYLYFVLVLGYIDEFEIIDDHRNGKIVILLNGRLNKCGIISPRFSIKVADMEKWVNKCLPSRQFGKLVLTTSQGIMDHETARKRHTGGKVLGFFY
jgi:small subunit ribosomal protein S15Ae